MNKLFLLLMLSACSLHAAAQSAEEISARYPGENAVVLDRTLHYTMLMKDGQPYVESRESRKLLYLTSSPAYLGRYTFYHSMFHELKEYAAYTQTTANRKIKVTDFTTSNSSSGSVFYDDAKETRFDFPSVGAGATGNLEYSVVHTKPYLLPPFYFAHRVPVIHTELKITFANNIGVKYVLKGLDTSAIKVKKLEKRRETTYVFYMDNVDGSNTYADAPDAAWYEPHVVFYIDHYINDEGETVRYLSDVDDLYKLNSGFLKDVNQVPGKELKTLVTSLVQDCKTETDKARVIYSWVQNHIKYIAFEDGMGGFIPRDANLVLHRRFGDCKDMAGLLTMMLRTAGVNAYYTWIGTRSLPYKYSETPLPIVDNHMICVARINGRYVFLDGTDPFCVFGSVPSGIQDKEALVDLGNNQYKILRVPTRKAEDNVQHDSTFIELTSDGIKGNINLKLKGYYAVGMHALVKTVSERDHEKTFTSIFQRGSNKFKMADYKVGDTTNKNELTLTANFTLDGYARKIDDEWYVNMHLIKPYEGQEIDYPKREIPIEKEFLFTREFVTELKIPEGYKVSYLPENKSFANDAWDFDLNYKVLNDAIVCTLRFRNNHLMINRDLFEQWNKVLENLYPTYKETVTLSKK